MNRSKCQSLFTRVAVFAFLSVLATGQAHAIEVQVSNAPQNNLLLTVGAIQSAKKSIYLNIYELSSADIADALIQQIKAGVAVAIIEEGAPVGGLSTAAKGIQSQLATAMSASKLDHLFQMSTATAGSKRRYRFDHAKYAVIDEEWLLIGSENYSPTGNPSPGSVGNRGWEVFIHDAQIAQQYKTIFLADSSTQFGDITELGPNHQAFSAALAGQKDNHFINRNAIYPASSVSQITSPDTSLNGLIALINGSKKSIDLEQMTFDSDWNKIPGTSPLSSAIIAASKRGVKVRVLLNDEHVFDHPNKPAAPHNTDTVTLFNNAKVNAKIANLKAMGVDYIHNKGMLIDGSITLISSINWDQNSVQNNREAAVAIVSPEVNQYYQALFNQDWLASGGTGMEMIRYDFDPSPGFLCPTSLHLVAQIGALTISDVEDADFKLLSGLKIEGTFVASSSINGCVLTQEVEGRTTHERQYVELRARPDGSVLFSFEGYTPKTNKIFSIRGNLKVLTANMKAQATIYDGSGPSREALGTASLSLGIK